MKNSLSKLSTYCITPLILFFMMGANTASFAQGLPSSYLNSLQQNNPQANKAPTGPLGQNSTQAQEINPNAEIVGNIVLVDESPNQVFALLEKLTGKSILRKQILPPVKLNFNSQKPLTKGEAIDALTSILALNGIAVTAVGDKFLKAVPTIGVNAESPEILTQSSLDLPPSERVVTKIFKVNYLPIKESIPTLQPFLSKGTGSLVPFYNNNSFLVTDSLLNVQRLENLLLRLDRPIEMREEVHFFQLRNVSATDIQNRLNRLKESGLTNYLSGSTFFEADDRTNQLIVITHSNNISMIEKLVHSLDLDIQPISQSEVYYLKHANSVKVAEVIQKIIDGQKQARKDTEKEKKDSNKLASAAKEIEKKETHTIATETIAENLQFSPLTTIVADERSNSIVAYGMPGDLKQVHKLIEKIDVLLSQVAIEVVIAEVRLLDGQTRGLESFGINFNLQPLSPGSSTLVPGGNDLSYNVIPGTATPPTGPKAFTLNSFGTLENFNIQTVFNTAKQKDNIRILSAPTILTTHNKKGIIKIVDTIPFLKDQTTQLNLPEVTTNSVDYKDVGIELQVTPLIGQNGIIQMEIKQVVSDISGSTTVGSGVNTQKVPNVSKREAESFVSVEDGEMIILGGLQQVNDVDTKHKMFFFGDLPILGDSIFTSRTKTLTIRELIFFIRPIMVVYPTDDKTRIQKMIDQSYNQEDIQHYIDFGHFTSYGCENVPPTCPPAYCEHNPLDFFFPIEVCTPCLEE